MAKKYKYTLLIASLLCATQMAPSQAKSKELDLEFSNNYSQAVRAEKHGNFLEAVKLYQAAHEVKHRDTNTLMKLGLMYLNNTVSVDLQNKSLEKALEYFEKAQAIKPGDAMLNMLLAKTYQELGDAENSIKYYLKASNIDSENILLKANLGQLYFEKKDFKKTIEIFNKIILAYPDNLRARSYLGAALQSTDNYLAAIEQYNYVLKFEPDDYSIIKNLADSWLAVKQYDKAAEFYAKARDIDPNVPDIYADLAFVSEQTGKDAVAIDNYRKALKLKDNSKWKRALAHTLWDNKRLEEAITVFNEIAEHKIAGFLHQKLGNSDEAVASYEKAIDQDSKDRKSRYNLARIYHERKELNSAKEQYEILLKQKPNDMEVLFLLAVLEHDRGQVEAALSYYSEILDLPVEESEFSNNSELIKNNVHYNLGLVYKSQQKLAKAEENFEELLVEENETEGFDKTKEVYKELSFIKIALDKDTEAEKLINDWLREDPTSVEARNLYADFLVHGSKERKAIEQLRLASVLDKTIKTRLKLANLLHSQNNLYEALAEYQTILQNSPDNLHALLGAANNFKSLGFKDEAINIYRRATKEHPEDVLANYNYGLLMQESGNIDLALKHYSKVLELNPNFLQTYYVIGLAYWDLKDKDKARENWDIFMSQTSDEKLKQEIEKLLKDDEAKMKEAQEESLTEDVEKAVNDDFKPISSKT